MDCMSADVAAFVITTRRKDLLGHVTSIEHDWKLPVNGEIKTHQFSELLVVAIAQHAGEVGRPIEFWVNGADALSVTVSVAVDGGGNDWQLCNQVHAVLVDRFPILAFVNTLTR